jgi:hypothetical protein
MAKKRSASPKRATKKPETERPAVTPERCARLYRLVQLLAEGPKKREVLARRLGVDVRGFYRDLELLRIAGVDAQLSAGRYDLAQNVKEALALLPFHDPLMTLGEAFELSKGRTAAHRKLKLQINHIVNPA